MNKKLEWFTEKRRIDDLVPFQGNPRKVDDRQFSALKKSLKRFGLSEIPAIDTDNTILAGHARLRVLQLLGKGSDMIDVRVPSRKLTESERKAYLLTSNAVTGSWDYNLLREFDTDLILSIGFNPEELQNLWDNLQTEDDDWNEEKEIAKIKTPRVKLGDLFQLGPHRLIVGDGCDLHVVKKLVGDTEIDFVDVDPPFGIGYSYQGKNNKYGGIEKDNRSEKEYREFIRSLIQNCIAVSKKDAHFIFWCDERKVFLLQELYQELGILSQRLCVWVKNNAMPTPKIAFNKATEFACYGTRGQPYLDDKVKTLNTILNKDIGTGNQLIDDITDFFNIWLVKRLPGSQYLHPTEKSPTLHEKALRRCTRVGDAVLDLTAGSGSLMVSCEQMKRRAFLCEIDPLFATLILNRYEKISRQKATKLN